LFCELIALLPSVSQQWIILNGVKVIVQKDFFLFLQLLQLSLEQVSINSPVQELPDLTTCQRVMKNIKISQCLLYRFSTRGEILRSLLPGNLSNMQR
jgi:hypothetical protein